MQNTPDFVDLAERPHFILAEAVGPWEMEDSGGAGMVREDSLTGLDYLERSREPLDRQAQKGGQGWKWDSGLSSTHVITKVPLNG